MFLYSSEEDLDNALLNTIALATQTAESIEERSGGVRGCDEESTQAASEFSPNATPYIGPAFEFVYPGDNTQVNGGGLALAGPAAPIDVESLPDVSIVPPPPHECE